MYLWSSVNTTSPYRIHTRTASHPPHEIMPVKLHADGISTGKRNIQTHSKQGTENFEVPVALMTFGWDPSGDPTHNVGASRDRSCAYRMLEMGRVVKWFTSHARGDSYKHEKVEPHPGFSRADFVVF